MTVPPDSQRRPAGPARRRGAAGGPAGGSTHLPRPRLVMAVDPVRHVRGFEAIDLRRRELQVDRRTSVGDVLDLGGSDDGGDDAGNREHPGEGDYESDVDAMKHETGQ